MSTELDTETVDLVGDEVAANLARAALFAALTGASAYVSFPNPFAPGVPVTLQVLAVFLAGIYLGPVWGAVSMSLYLAAGAAGVPVWAGGSAGIGALLGNTAGYLWSYPFAAAAIGVVVHRGLELGDPHEAELGALVGGMVLGTAIIYGFGVAGAMIVTGIGLTAAVQGYAVAFVPAEAFKIAAAVGIVRNEEIQAA
jgi:biotin transport system substrate-specific component